MLNHLHEDQHDYDFNCPVCGLGMELEACWQCHGAGGWHDCGEDTCCCLNTDEITEWCPECEGKGRYRQCPGLPHSKEQMAAYKARKQQSERGGMAQC